MTDIVEELRKYAVGSSLPVERELIEKAVDEIENLRNSYNQAIDDAADLLNCVDLPRDELAAAVRRLKK